MCTVDVRKKTCKLLRDKQFLLQSRLCIWTEVTHQRSITPQTSMSAKLWFHENLNGFLRKMIECLRNLRPHHPPEKGEEGIHISKWIFPPTSTISAMVILITSPGEKSPRFTWGWNYSLIGTNGTYQRKWSLIAIPNHTLILYRRILNISGLQFFWISKIDRQLECYRQVFCDTCQVFQTKSAWYIPPQTIATKHLRTISFESMITVIASLLVFRAPSAVIRGDICRASRSCDSPFQWHVRNVVFTVWREL